MKNYKAPISYLEIKLEKVFTSFFGKLYQEEQEKANDIVERVAVAISNSVEFSIKSREKLPFNIYFSEFLSKEQQEKLFKLLKDEYGIITTEFVYHEERDPFYVRHYLKVIDFI